jgi:quercetin dioxygenase-like cupin family protein
MTNLAALGEIAPRAIWDGVAGRVVAGERITLAVVELDPNALVPEHHHPHEQLGIVLEGSVTFRVGDETRQLEPGGTWRIPGDVPHEVRAGERGAIVVDVFTPVRADWDQIVPDEPRRPRWPSRDSDAR